MIRKTPKNYSSSLKPAHKISFSIRSRFTESRFYQRNLEAQEEKKALVKIQREEELKTLILSKIFIALDENHYFEGTGKITETVIIAVPRYYGEDIPNVLQHKELISYDIRMTPAVKDATRLFETFPVFLAIKSRG